MHLRVLAMLAVSAGSAGAQELKPPGSWKWVLDAPATMVAAEGSATDSTFWFVGMPPGWHVTMGPGAILYDPRYFAEGNWTLEAEIVGGVNLHATRLDVVQRLAPMPASH